MRKAIFSLFIICVFLCELLFAQNVADKKFERHTRMPLGQGAVFLKSRPVEFRNKDFEIDFPKTTNKKRIYLKLKNSPTKPILSKLSKFGISLKEYIAEDTYIVEMNQNMLNAMKNMPFIAGFSEIDHADKMSERLYKQDIPVYAKDGNYVKLIVAVYDDILFDDAVSQIRSVGGILQSKEFSRTHKLRITIHSENIINLVNLDTIKYVEEQPPPPTTNNIDAGKISNVFWDNDGNTISGLFDQDYRENPPVPYGLTGFGVNVALKDGGAIYSHSDFNGRLSIVDNDAIDSHPTHVAGTIGSALSINDNDGNTGGMAELVHLYSYSYNVDGNNPPVIETDYTVDYVNAVTMRSAFIINNSWGHVFNQQNKSLLGDYSSSAQDIDDFIYDYYDNDVLLTKSAGNYREIFYQDCDGYYTMDDLSCTKNTVVVGSVGITEADNEISYFSSCGPADDGRIKPDVVADGFELTSTIFVDNEGQYADSYSDNDSCGHINEQDHEPTCRKYWKGTSMSCPVVTGISALIHQAYKDTNSEFPTADIVKALLCNYAKDLGKPGPDFSYGFGLADAKACIDAIFNYDGSEGGHIQKGVIGETGDYLQYQFELPEDLDASETVKVTLVWIDPPGNPASANAIVNDLDLSIFDNEGNLFTAFYFKEYDEFSGTEYEVDPTLQAKTGGLLKNRYDTVEQVELYDIDNDGIIPAGTYTIEVRGGGISLLNQPFAVVSQIGFRGFNFNTLKVKGADEIWVSNQFAVLDKNPDVLLRVSELENEGFNPGSFEYSYSTDNGVMWSVWSSVTGVYENENCTQLCSKSAYRSRLY